MKYLYAIILACFIGFSTATYANPNNVPNGQKGTVVAVDHLQKTFTILMEDGSTCQANQRPNIQLGDEVIVIEIVTGGVRPKLILIYVDTK